MQLLPYTEAWEATDPHANFKADVAQYTAVDPLPTLEGLSQATGVPGPCLARYILVKYAASNADALLAMGPLVLHQMEQLIAQAEAEDSVQARLRAYEGLRQIVAWLQAGLRG
ncbi:MAG: hypothetical protein JNK29_07145 [Anaerolineales bacterium]|nr:hypothetical protein [Anaerolineales bacterium]